MLVAVRRVFRASAVHTKLVKLETSWPPNITRPCWRHPAKARQTWGISHVWHWEANR